MITLKKNKRKIHKTKSKTKPKLHYKKRYTKLYKQNGSGFDILGTVSGALFTNTKKRNMTVKIPGSNLFTTTKHTMKRLIQPQLQKTQPDIITIIYNYRTSKEMIINYKSINKLYQSSYVQTVPYIQMKSIHYFFLVIVLAGMKPKLLWAIDLNNGSKSRSILDYDLPKFHVGVKFKLMIKLYKYPDTIINTLNIVNKDKTVRDKSYNELHNYILKNNILKPIFYKEMTIIQDKGSSIDNIFNSIIK